MSIVFAKLGNVAPAKPAKLKSNDAIVWQLNLDQIESGSGRIIGEVFLPVSQAGNSTHWFDEGHVLYSKLRPYLNKVVVPNKPGLATTELVPMRPDPKRLDRNYLAYYLRSDRFVNWVNIQVAGAKMPRVSMKVFWEHEIPLPPLPEQHRIVAILDKADAMRRKRHEAIRLTEEFLRSVFLDMFGDPVTNPKGWEVKKFGEVGSLDRGVSKHRPRNAPELLGGLHPLIQTGDVANCDGYIRSFKSTYSDLGLKQSKIWHAGTLCITIAANIAKTGILSFDSCFPDSVVGFSPNAFTTTEYVQYWLGFLQRVLEKNAPESAQKNINLAILRGLDIPIPPIELQQKFTKLVKSATKMKERQILKIGEVEALFNSLAQRAFKGDL